MAALMYFAEVYQSIGYDGYSVDDTDAAIAEITYTSAGGTTPPSSRAPTALVAAIKAYMVTYAGPWTISLSMTPPSGGTFDVGANYSGTITVTSATGNGVGGLGLQAPPTGGPNANQISNFVWSAPTTNAAGQISFTWNLSGVPAVFTGVFSAQTMRVVSPAPGGAGSAPPAYAAPGGSNGQTMVVSGVSEPLVTSFGGIAGTAEATLFGAIKVRKGVNDGAYYGPGGAVFQIYSTFTVLMDTITTNGTGIAQTPANLPAATSGTTYDVREVTPPPGYGTQPDQTVTVYPAPAAPGLATFAGTNEDRILPAELGAKKIDSQTGAPLAGATFAFSYDPAHNGVYSKVLGSCTTGGTGTCSPPIKNTTGGWLAGDYQVTETAAPPGYWLDPTTAVQTVTIAPGASAVASVTFGDLLLGSLELHKTGNDPAYWAVAGAVFTVTGPARAKASVGTLTVGPTGSTGTLTGLVPGSYTLAETTVPAGYAAVTPITVSVAAGHATTAVTAADLILPGTLRVTKTDAETRAPLPGATFDVRYDATDDGSYSANLGSCTTGPGGTCAPTPNDGTGYLPGNYEAIETAAPPGYYLPTPQPVLTFTLAPSGSATPDLSDHILVPATFEKVASGNVSSTLVDLAGAVIDVAPGTTWGGAIVTSCVTSASGKCATAANLVSGSPYCWREVTAPPGLEAGASGCFVATNGQGAEPIMVTDPGMFVPVALRKVDAGTAHLRIAGATYDLYRVDTKVTVPAPPPPNDPAPGTEPGQIWVGRATTNVTGVATFGLQYPGYRYCVLEVTPPDNYAATDDEHCTPTPVLGSTASPPPVTTITVADVRSLVTLHARKFAAASPTTVIPNATYDLYVVGGLPPGTDFPEPPPGPDPATEPGDAWYARGTTNATGALTWVLPAGFSWCLHEVTAPPEYAPSTGLYCSPVLTTTTPASETTIALPETVAMVTIVARKYNDTNPADVIGGATYEIVGQGTPPAGYAASPDPADYPVPTGDWYYGAATTNAAGLVSFSVPAGDSWCLHEVVVPAGYQQDAGWHCTPVVMRDPPSSATTLALPETPTTVTIDTGGGLPHRGGSPLWPTAGWASVFVVVLAGALTALLMRFQRRRRRGRGATSHRALRLGARFVVIVVLFLAFAVTVPVLSIREYRSTVPTQAPVPSPPFSLDQAPPASTSHEIPSVGSSRVVIPSIGVSARLVAESISHGQLGIPPDVHQVGEWEGGGETDGTQGTVLLAGHLDWVGQGDGALYPLAQVRPGATVYVSSSVGQVTSWAVVSARAYTKSDLPQTIFSGTGPRRLVLVTCGGTFDAATGHYGDNVVVTAEPEGVLS
jgi:hypothetical protein